MSGVAEGRFVLGAGDGVRDDASPLRPASHVVTIALRPTRERLRLQTDAIRAAAYAKVIYGARDDDERAATHAATLNVLGGTLDVRYDGHVISPPAPLPPEHSWRDGAFVIDQLVWRTLAKDPTWTPIYGCGLLIGRAAVALLGASGSGKTTLGLTLAARGAALYGDEMLLLARTTRVLTAVPRPLLVRGASLARIDDPALRARVERAVELCTRAGPLRVVPLTPAERERPPRPLRAVFVLAPPAASTPPLAPLPLHRLPPRLRAALDEIPCYRLAVDDPQTAAQLVLEASAC